MLSNETKFLLQKLLLQPRDEFMFRGWKFRQLYLGGDIYGGGQPLKFSTWSRYMWMCNLLSPLPWSHNCPEEEGSFLHSCQRLRRQGCASPGHQPTLAIGLIHVPGDPPGCGRGCSPPSAWVWASLPCGGTWELNAEQDLLLLAESD